MNRQETGQIIRRLSGYYPNAMAKLTGDKAAIMLESWTDALAAYDLATVERAVKNLSKTSRFFPSIPELLTEIERVRSLKVAEDWFMANAEKVQGENMQDPEFAAWYRDQFWRWAAQAPRSTT